MRILVVAALIVVSFAARPLIAQELTSVQIHAGSVDLQAFVRGERQLPLIEPTVATEPAFDPEIESYAARLPYGVDGITLVVEASSMYEFGVVDLNGTGGEFQALTYERTPFQDGKIMSFSMPLGDNRLRLGVKFINSAVYEFLITRPDAPSGDMTLTDLQLGGGELSPAFDANIKTYRTRIVGDNRLTVAPTPNAGSATTVAGTAADGTVLEVDGDLVSGLSAGENTIDIEVRAEDGTTESYTLTVDVIPSNDTTLAALQLGSGELSPAFDTNGRAYRARIVGNGLTVTPTPSSGSVSVSGTAADGTTLEVDGDLVTGLTAGENAISVMVQAQDGTSERYTLTVEVSDDIRAVTEGDAISQQRDCDSDIGCDGTLNGVEGRFVCNGVDWSSESPNMRISVSGFCSLSTTGGVVTSASGWFFASFPASDR